MDNKQLAMMLMEAETAVVDKALRSGRVFEDIPAVRSEAVKVMSAILDLHRPIVPMKPNVQKFATLAMVQMIAHMNGDRPSVNSGERLGAALENLFASFRLGVLDEASQAATDGDAKLEELLRK